MGAGEQQGEQQRAHRQQQRQGKAMNAASGHVGSSREGWEGGRGRAERDGTDLQPGRTAEASTARGRLRCSHRMAGNSAK